MARASHEFMRRGNSRKGAQVQPACIYHIILKTRSRELDASVGRGKQSPNATEFLKPFLTFPVQCGKMLVS